MSASYSSLFNGPGFSVDNWIVGEGIWGKSRIVEMNLLSLSMTYHNPGNKWLKSCPFTLCGAERDDNTTDTRRDITSFLRRNDVASSFRRKNDVIIASCVHWVHVQIQWQHSTESVFQYISHQLHWLLKALITWLPICGGTQRIQFTNVISVRIRYATP